MTDETGPARPGVFGPIAAAGYERSMGRWSRRLAPLFLDFLGENGPGGGSVLDLGCGTAASPSPSRSAAPPRPSSAAT